MKENIYFTQTINTHMVWITFIDKARELYQNNAYFKAVGLTIIYLYRDNEGQMQMFKKCIKYLCMCIYTKVANEKQYR